MDIDAIIKKYPKFEFLKSERFLSLSEEKQAFLLECVQDAVFWHELEQKPNAGNGFKFLAATYGLQKAENEAAAKGLQGKERESFMKSHQELFSMFNPFGGLGNAE